MPPTRLLVKDFITSLLTSESANIKSAANEQHHVVDSMVISDDENDAPDANTLRRKAIQKEQESMQAEILKKKEALSSMEKKMKNMKLDVAEEFEI